MSGKLEKRLAKLSVFTVTFTALIALSLLNVPLAFAQHPAGFGNLMVSGGSWLGGQGVNAYSNGTSLYTSYEYCTDPNSTPYGASINTGMVWQCVELPQRLYTEQGWHKSLFPVGCAYEIYDIASSINAKSYPNDGNGYVPVPGDMVVLDGGPWCDDAHTHHVGHVSVVDYVDSTSVHVVEQNWDNTTGRAIYTRSGNNGSVLSRATLKYTVRGVVHSFSNRNTNGGGGSDTDIYVSLSGNDASNGSSGSPFRTVAHAVAYANATQPVTIHIAPGTYGEKIGASKHIQFVTWGAGTVRIGG